MGIDKLFDHRSKPFVFEEVVSGIIGLGPAENPEGKSRHFMHQLKQKGTINDITFSIAMDSRDNFKDSNIQFGGYNPGYIKDGSELTLIKTFGQYSWGV